MKKFLHKHGTVIALTLAGFFHLVSHLGTQFERYQICFAPSERAERGCEKDIDLVVLKQLYDLSLYGEGNGSEFKREWIDIIKKSTVVRNIPASNPDIPKYSLAVLGLIIYARYNQGLKASALQNSYSSDLEAFKTQVYENWVHGFNERKVIFKKQEFQAERDIATEINKLRGQGELTHLQEVLKRSNAIDEARFDLALEEIAASKSEFTLIKSENLRDAAKADKEMNKALGKNNDSGNNTGTDSKNKELINQLVNALKEHESGWLYKVLKIRKPLWIIGGQGAGKSTLAASIILLRHYIFGWELIEIVDAHAQKNCTKAWKYLMELGDNPPAVVGANNDYESINTSFTSIIERWTTRTEDDTPTQSLADEFTNLSDAPECKESAGRFVKHSLSDIRKAAEYWVFIAHYFTATATGDAKGTHTAKNNQTIQIERYSADGERPLSNATVNGLVDEKGKAIKNLEVTIPNWLRPETIYGHLNGKPIQFEG
ncbi:hypothetical protein NIES4071_109280 (plasmid) [Calothrix sp. NIES-4071]|nr:hypothetical protein NIES4071_109280 [Calothrix sp. NIES-4071]BAZ65191.1 hypothetical protein NIES4105_109240 [Calothrix sp. NIES-4105]